jgi:hypothetical protein
LCNRIRTAAKFLLKFLLFSLIFLLEVFLQSSVIVILAGLVFWVLLLFLMTSPLWIPLSICWAPAALITYLVFRYTQVKTQNMKAKPLIGRREGHAWC